MSIKAESLRGFSRGNLNDECERV